MKSGLPTIGLTLLALLASCVTPTQPSRSPALSDEARMPSFRGVAERILPSVVEIHVSGYEESALDDVLPFDYRFGPGDDRNRSDRTPGIGSGVVVDQSGSVHYVVTNNHVVRGADSITVVTGERHEYDAELVGTDERRDLAIIAFTTADDAHLPLAPLGNSDALFVGDWVLAVGNPFGFTSTITAGIVSAKERPGPEDNISDFIQTDAAINQGNSGGPLVNLDGEVVGINTWITTPNGINVGVGFAIPINNIRQAIADIIANGIVEYGWLGVEVEDITPVTAAELEFTLRSGALISQVFASSPAARGDLRPGDIVVSIDDVRVRDYLHLVRLIGDAAPDSEIGLGIYREGTIIGRSVVIARRGSDSDIHTANRTMWPGISVVPLSAELRNVLEAPDAVDGVMVYAVKSAAAPQAVGIRQGDIITSINGADVKNLLDFFHIVNDTDTREFDLRVLRKGEPLSFRIHRGSRE